MMGYSYWKRCQLAVANGQLKRAGRAVAGSAWSRRKVRAGQGTVVANGHRGPAPILPRVAKWGPGNPRESATEKTQPMVPTRRDTGNGEKVRQERTAAAVTSPARQTPPPARPSNWLGASGAWPECEWPTRSLGQWVGRFPRDRESQLATVGQDKWPPPPCLLSKTETGDTELGLQTRSFCCLAIWNLTWW